MPLLSTILSPDAATTRRIGAALAGILRPGAVVALHGPLGAGKTTLAQGIALGLGIIDPVISPTFVLVREYDIPADDGPWASDPPARLVHLDFYRLAGSPEALDLGLGDYLAGGDVVVVEWPERASDALPIDDRLDVTLAFEDGGDSETRRITVTGRGEWVGARSVASLPADPLSVEPMPAERMSVEPTSAESRPAGEDHPP